MQADRSRAFPKPQSRLPETAVAATKAKDGDVTVADLVVAMMAQGDVTVAEIVQPDSQPASKAASLWALLLFGQQPMANQVGGSVRYATTSQWPKTVLLVANLRRRVLANVHAGDTQICPTTRRSAAHGARIDKTANETAPEGLADKVGVSSEEELADFEHPSETEKAPEDT